MVKSAIIAVTLNCNSHCIMCNIWQNRIVKELEPKEYLKLPSTLKDINITGGEPFLRTDLVEIIRNMKIAAPKARLIINTNGFMPERIVKMMREILKIDPSFAFRVSIDGIGDKHDKIRNTPNGFTKAINTLNLVKTLGAKDLGLSFTLGSYNMEELPKVQEYCIQNHLEFSLTVATGSEIYFGKDKLSYRPANIKNTENILSLSAHKHLSSFKPKEIVRGWFVKQMIRFLKTGKRTLICDAAKAFFYMDSTGNVYTCHLQPWLLGNITKQPISTILSNQTYTEKVKSCNGCWMICTAKTAMRKEIVKVIGESIYDMISSSL
jgi:Fe-coproporphyrin III synthase